MFSQHPIGFGASFGAASNWPEAPLRACQNETENTAFQHLGLRPGSGAGPLALGT